MKHLFASLLLMVLCLFSQSKSNAQFSLDKERVDRLKKAVVRISIDNDKLGTGTGFFVLDNGDLWVATCWHVIQSALVPDPVVPNKINPKKIEVELYNKEKIEAEFASYLLREDRFYEAVIKDYCLIKLKRKPKGEYNILQMSRFATAEEGDQIYTSGYPLGILQPVLASGNLSSKWSELVGAYQELGKTDTTFISRDVAWLDLAMNRGNSGGPILKVGRKPTDDRVIGIATFILNPFAKKAELIKASVIRNEKGGFSIQGVDIAQAVDLYSDAISNNSIGVSGCVSVDYLAGVLVNPEFINKESKR